MTRPHWKKIAMALKARMESDGYTVTLTRDGAETNIGIMVKNCNSYSNTAGMKATDPEVSKNPWWRWPWWERRGT